MPQGLEHSRSYYEIEAGIGFGLASLHGTPAATHRASARTNLPDLRLAVGGLRLSCGADLGGLPAAPSSCAQRTSQPW